MSASGGDGGGRCEAAEAGHDAGCGRRRWVRGCGAQDCSWQGLEGPGVEGPERTLTGAMTDVSGAALTPRSLGLDSDVGGSKLPVDEFDLFIPISGAYTRDGHPAGLRKHTQGVGTWADELASERE